MKFYCPLLKKKVKRMNRLRDLRRVFPMNFKEVGREEAPNWSRCEKF